MVLTLTCLAAMWESENVYKYMASTASPFQLDPPKYSCLMVTLALKVLEDAAEEYVWVLGNSIFQAG